MVEPLPLLVPEAEAEVEAAVEERQLVHVEAQGELLRATVPAELRGRARARGEQEARVVAELVREPRRRQRLLGDEAFQRKCFGKIFEFKQRGGTIVFVSHDASAVERLCDRAILLRQGRVEFDGPTHDAIVRYHKQLADERDPEERTAGLREWGSGEVRIEDPVVLGPGGEERAQFLAGEPFTLQLRVVAQRELPAPRLSFEVRDSSGLLLAGGSQPTAELGWSEDTAALTVRFDVEQLPLADGRFHVRLGLADATGERLYHWLDDALVFVVYPADDVRGTVRLDGRWSGEEIGAQAEKVAR